VAQFRQLTLNRLQRARKAVYETAPEGEQLATSSDMLFIKEMPSRR